MIAALLRDPFLRGVVEAAAHRDEDVVAAVEEVLRVLRTAHPRVLVVDTHHADHHGVREAAARNVPVVWVRETDVERWEEARRCEFPPPPRLAFHAVRLRAVLPGGAPTRVERVLAELARLAGRPLPHAFRAVARRVLDDPGRYTVVEDLEAMAGAGADALRARFRRRDLPSPAECLRWLRLLAVVIRLVDARGTTTTEVALGAGFTSPGNLARSTRALIGRLPGELRHPAAETEVMLRLAGVLLAEERLEAWESLEGIGAAEAA